MPDKKKKTVSASSASFDVSGRTSLDVSALKQVVEILESSEVTHLSWTNGDERLTIRRGPPPAVVHQHALPPSGGAGLHVVASAPSAPAPAAAESPRARPSMPQRLSPAATPAAEPAVEKKGHLVTSPFVGTFYRSPAPDQPSYTDVGSSVKKGQVICIIEAMKLMNEIECDVAGKVAEVLVQNGQPVEFGQPLFRIEA